MIVAMLQPLALTGQYKTRKSSQDGDKRPSALPTPRFAHIMGFGGFLGETPARKAVHFVLGRVNCLFPPPHVGQSARVARGARCGQPPCTQPLLTCAPACTPREIKGLPNKISGTPGSRPRAAQTAPSGAAQQSTPTPVDGARGRANERNGKHRATCETAQAKHPRCARNMRDGLWGHSDAAAPPVVHAAPPPARRWGRRASRPRRSGRQGARRRRATRRRRRRRAAQRPRHPRTRHSAPPRKRGAKGTASCAAHL